MSELVLAKNIAKKETTERNSKTPQRNNETPFPVSDCFVSLFCCLVSLFCFLVMSPEKDFKSGGLELMA